MSGDHETANLEMDSGEDVEEVSSPDTSPSKMKEMKEAALKDPKLLAAMEDQLNGLSIDPAAFVQGLPAVVRRRLKALKKLQYQHAKTEAKFYEEIHALEARFSLKYAGMYEKRAHIVSGEVEPTDSECEWASEPEDEDEDEEEGEKKKPAIESAEDKNVKGMPDFWLITMQHVGELSELIHEHDEAILSHLSDIRVLISQPGEPMGFTLEFHFTANDFFSNSVLTKKYNMKVEPDTDDCLYEGPEVVTCEGCTVEWKAGKNVTVKTIKKKQKHKKSGVHRTVSKQVPNESFFNFFSPIPIEEQEEPTNEDVEATLQSDFELGHFFREQVVPRAVLYFTGDAVEVESDEDFDEDDEDEDDDDDEEGGSPSKMAAVANGGEKPECKQQ